MLGKLLIIIILLIASPSWSATCTPSNYLGCLTGDEDTLNITTSDTDTNIRDAIQALGCGDEAVFATGTYNIANNNLALIKLTQDCSIDNKITIRGASSTNRPVLDFQYDTYGTVNDGNNDPPVSSNPRGYHGAFIVWGGSHINFQDLIIKNLHRSDGGVWGMYLFPDGGPINVSNCLFQYCDGGIDAGSARRDSGWGSDTNDIVTISNCEFDGNLALASAGNANHHIYNSGGRTVIEYCYFHGQYDRWQIGGAGSTWRPGQIVHSRDARLTVRFSWLEDPASYMLDVADAREDNYGTESYEFTTQEHTYIGNVFVNKNVPQNTGQVFVVFENQEQSFQQILYLYYNTIIGYGPTSQSGLVHIDGSGSDESENGEAYVYNNIFYNWAGTISRCDGGSTQTMYSQYNIYPTGMSDGDCLSDANDITVSTDQFMDYANDDYNLITTSSAVGAANSGLGSTPTYEYVQDSDGKPRREVDDIGGYDYYKYLMFK